ncbi:MAG TPA: sigma-70 factor domain-containing protein, partial [Stenomitos sp.]
MAKVTDQKELNPAPSGRDMVRTYLHEIGRVPLLTHEQEIVYGKQVQQMMALLEAQESLAQRLGQSPTLAQWAEVVGMEEA